MPAGTGPRAVARTDNNGRRVASGLRMLVVPGSESVRREAEAEELAACRRFEPELADLCGVSRFTLVEEERTVNLQQGRNQVCSAERTMAKADSAVTGDEKSELLGGSAADD